MGSGDCRVGIERAAKDVVPEPEPGELRKQRPRGLGTHTELGTRTCTRAVASWVFQTPECDFGSVILRS